MKYQVIPCIQQSNADYLVFCSDLMGRGSFWEPQVHFFRQYFHVFIYDQAGSYLDLASPLLKEDFGITDLAAQLHRMLKHAKIERFHCAGLGMGGLIGMELANRMLESHEQLLSLSLINSWPNLDPHTRKCADTRITLLKKVGIQAFVEAQSLLLYPPEWISTHAEIIAQEEQKKIELFPAVHNVLVRMNAMIRYHLDQDTLQVLKQIPIHIIANKHDFFVPYHQSKKLKMMLPRASYTELTSGGHASTVTDPQLMNQAILSRIRSFELNES